MSQLPQQQPQPHHQIRPQPGPQEAFLATPADIAIYGGAAFGGKTWALVAGVLRHAANPKFGAVIFRRESVQITNEGGLWDESLNLYPLAGATPLSHKLQWKFASSAKVSFRHLQHENDKLAWQGAQICELDFDELTHFTESQFWYLLSRNRSTCGVRPYVRATCNPEPGWVKEFLGQWVDKTHPDPAASGELRWMVRDKGQLVWAHSRQELVDRFPKQLPKSVTFIKATIFDNKIGMAKDPDYLGNLQALPPVEQARLLDGDWDVRREGLCYPGLLDAIGEAGPILGRKVGGIDFGWNHPFCGLGAVLDHDDVLWVGFERYKSFATLPTHSEALPKDGTCWAADPSRPDSISELNNAGHFVVPCVHKGKSPIVEGIALVVDRIRTGRLKISRACQHLLREAGLYVFGPDGQPVDSDNHSCDALRYLVTMVDRGHAIPRKPKALPTAAETAAKRTREAEASAAKRAKFLHPDNPHWWGDGD